ncbi:hydrolase [Mesorhizobium sp. B4-1-3]|uniref:hydrolase n=1 Tax=Mesorhizobium sp. B4-1-3 TaxID=2589889 RepID=UPI00112EB39B|nr:hydrolase [Mesorhizobium sp. B4-1-3]TPI12971.1 hydrolase [Mesorhizobium sp. B4-1-3]
MAAAVFPKVGLEAMLTPENCVLVLIDHQAFQVAGVRNIDPQIMINNTVALAKVAKAFNVPTLLTTVIKDRGGELLKPIQEVFPDQVPIDRTTINTWEDKACVDWVKKTGRKKVVIAGLWTEICLAFPVIQALGEGWEVYFVTDASGGVSTEAHDRGVQRMIQAGGVPLTWIVFASELQRDWARESTVPALAQVLLDHGGATGTSLAWEWQLLGSHGGA